MKADEVTDLIARLRRFDNEAAADRIEELEAENERLRAIADPQLSFADLEMRMHDGTLDLKAMVDGQSQPAFRLLAALMLNFVLGDDETREEPPNYRSGQMQIRPAGEVAPITAALEVIKPGGKSSHEIRAELEADLDALARVLRQILRRPYVDDDNCVWPHGTAQSLDGVMADAVRRHVERKR